ncbi:hypothetical protein AOLI_G00172430 [Acnodon oligacanthus]
MLSYSLAGDGVLYPLTGSPGRAVGDRLPSMWGKKYGYGGMGNAPKGALTPPDPGRGFPLPDMATRTRSDREGNEEFGSPEQSQSAGQGRAGWQTSSHVEIMFISAGPS